MEKPNASGQERTDIRKILAPFFKAHDTKIDQLINLNEILKATYAELEANHTKLHEIPKPAISETQIRRIASIKKKIAKNRLTLSMAYTVIQFTKDRPYVTVFK